jgi:hypothetical protein
MRKIRRIIVIFLVIILFGGLWYLPRKIVVKSVECKNQEGECSQRIIDIVSKYVSYDLRNARKGIESDLRVELVGNDINFRYIYPSTLRVNVYETRPEFALSNLEANSFRLVDSSGNILTEASSTVLPYAKVANELPNVGERLDEKYVFGLKLLSDLSRSYQLSQGELSLAGLVIELPTQTKVLFPLEGDRDVVLGSFILVINQLNSVKNSSTMEKQVLAGKTVDLRYKNPVIR